MYTIIKDTREQHGWFFPQKDKCTGMEIGTLKTGDYGLKEFPDSVCIERKASPSEVATNFIKERTRFVKELERMQSFAHRYIICEFTMEELITYPRSMPTNNYVKSKIRVTGPYLLKVILEDQMKYNFQFLLCGSPYNAFFTASSIMKRIYETNSGV